MVGLIQNKALIDKRTTEKNLTIVFYFGWAKKSKVERIRLISKVSLAL
jgi:hypothetical protein